MTKTTAARRPSFAIATLMLLLAGCADGSTDQGGNSTAPLSGPGTPTEPVDGPGYTLLVNDDDIRGNAGRYALTARADFAPPLAVIDVPEGYAGFGFFALWPQDDGSDPPFSALNYWGVHAVYAHPCRSLRGATPPGESVAELAAALADQEATSATKPVPVTLDGHDGLYLELTMPTNVAFDKCEEGYFALWQGSPGDKHHFIQDPGLVERLWILDVDGDRVVLATQAAPGAPTDGVNELTAMVESVRFVEPD